MATIADRVDFKPFWIQTATLGQAEEIAQVVNESFLAKGRGFYRIPSSNRIELADLQAKLADRERFRVYVAMRKDAEGIARVIGASYLDIHDHEFCMFCTKVGEENSGLGSELIKHVEKCAKYQFDLENMVLDIVNDTREAYLKRFYERRGYEFTGTGAASSDRQFQYTGGEKIVPDERICPSDTIPLLLFNKKL